jgi:hypothetical protein
MMKHLSIGILVAVAVLIAAPPAFAAAEKAGDIISVRGKAIVVRPSSRVKAKRRTPLWQADTIYTRSRARLKILFKDDSVFTLGSRSRLLIKNYIQHPESKKRNRSIYELADGKLRAVVGKKRFRVTTPTAFAAARGTVFVTWYDSKMDRTGLAVIEGNVLVKNISEMIKGERTVKAGQMLFVPAHQPPGKPVPIDLTGPAGRIIAELSGDYTPDPDVPPPVLGKRDIMSLMRMIPTVPPLNQVPKNVTPVSLNLTFQ